MHCLSLAPSQMTHVRCWQYGVDAWDFSRSFATAAGSSSSSILPILAFTQSIIVSEDSQLARSRVVKRGGDDSTEFSY